MGNVHNNERKRETWFPNTAKMRRMCVSVYVCVCMCERERERERETSFTFWLKLKKKITRVNL